MKWKKINKSLWENQETKEKYDFTIEKDDKTFILSIFNSEIGNPQEAYIESFEYSKLSDARKEAELYI